MKKISLRNKIVMVVLFAGMYVKSYSQGVPVIDVGANTALQQANLNLGAQTNVQMNGVVKYVEQIQKIKQYIHVAKEGMKQAKQTADIMTAIMNENYTVEGLGELKVNKNFKKVLEEVLCINFKDYVPNNKTMLRIHVQFMAGIGQCNNMQYYSNTYSGMDFKAMSNFYNNLSGKNNRLVKDEKTAKEYQEFSNTMNDRTKIEVGYKMLEIADEMIKSAEELQKVLNIGKSEMDEVGLEDFKMKNEKIGKLMQGIQGMASVNEVMDLGQGFESTMSQNKSSNDGSKGLDMTRAQRIELILKCKDYLQKGLEYKQKAIELINEGTNSKYAKNSINKKKRKLDLRQLQQALYKS